jgi:hypothetical protein
MSKWLAALREKSGTSGGTELSKGSKVDSVGFEPFESISSGGFSENSPSVSGTPHIGSWDYGTALKNLLRVVGAKAFLEDGKHVLRFEPPLESENMDPERWAKAVELEGLFWKLCEEHGYMEV